MRRGDLGWECIISKVAGVVGRVVGDGGCIDLPRGDGGGRRGDAGAPARSPFSTSSSSSISIYLPALLLLLLHLPLFPPTPTRSTHHPQLNGWLTQGLLGYMLRVFSSHRRTPTRVYVCARAKMVGPTSHLRFKHLLPLSPVRSSPSPRQTPPFPPCPLVLPLLLFLFSSSSFTPPSSPPCICICTRFSLSLSVF